MVVLCHPFDHVLSQVLSFAGDMLNVVPFATAAISLISLGLEAYQANLKARRVRNVQKVFGVPDRTNVLVELFARKATEQLREQLERLHNSQSDTPANCSILVRIGQRMENIMDFVEATEPDTPVKRKAESDAGKVIEAIMKGKVIVR